MNPAAKILILIGFSFICLGLLWQLTGGNIPLGRLPGDIRVEGENRSFYFPLTTCLLISGLLSLISYFFKKF